MMESSLYLYRIQPERAEMLTAGATEQEDKAVARHFEYLQHLTRSGVVLLAGRTLNTDSASFGIVIFRAGSEQAARSIMLADPAVRQGVFRAEIFPFRIALLGAMGDA